MATKDSEELKTDERYPLGDYSFRIERSSVPGSSNDKIEAICTKGGKNARKSIQVPSITQIDGWYDEANATEASVYILTQSEAPLVTGNIPCIGVPGRIHQSGDYYVEIKDIPSGFVTYDESQNSLIVAFPMPSGGFYGGSISDPGRGRGLGSAAGFTFSNQEVGYYVINNFWGEPISNYSNLVPRSNATLTDFAIAQQYGRSACIAWSMIFSANAEEKETLVARFAIDLEDAGGDGPGSDWTDPGDYDPDWEEGEPTHTLYVEATGALSGRHNDPIVDPSYSYIPADKDTVKDYGCGGDGGHGGGGGAGASTVVVHKFATNQANSKEVTAIARRHGYGSGGGKGGKGGDGYILI